MAVSVDWNTRIILVPQSDLTSIGVDKYSYDLNVFRLELKALEDDTDGMPFLDTHRHNTEVFLAGVTYSRTLEIINGYTVEFENALSPYSISLTGANHNISDVQVVNSASLIVNNSAGLQTVNVGGVDINPADVTLIDEVWDRDLTGHTNVNSAGWVVRKIRSIVDGVLGIVAALIGRG